MKRQHLNRSVQLEAQPHVTFRQLGGEPGGVVLHLETAQYFRVNQMGARIWELLKVETTFGQLIDAVSSELDEVPENLSSDLAEFLADLAERDLIRIDPHRSHE